MNKKSVKVVAGIIYKDEKILCSQRLKNKFKYISEKWEFPGGKIEQGETKEKALYREIEEEIGCKIKIKKHLMNYYHEYEDFNVKIDFYICDYISGPLKALVHKQHKFINKIDAKKLDWAKADIPVLDKL